MNSLPFTMLHLIHRSKIHIGGAILLAFLAYPVYLRHGEWWAVVAVLGVALNVIIFTVEDRK